jgi:hypothetical protein
LSCNPLFAASLALLLTPSAWGGIIDRVAASVGNQVITLRDVEMEIRVAAFLSGDKPDLSAKNKRDTVDRLVNQLLIRQEMESNRFPFPTAKDVQPMVDQLEKKFATEGDYQRALAQYGITGKDVEDILLRMWMLQEFISLRFKPAVQVTDQEIRDYFDRVVAPMARSANPGQPVELENFRTQIEDKLAGDKADGEMKNWLNEAHKRNEIVIHQEALE